MNKHDLCGIEVSAACLLAGLEREGAPRTRRIHRGFCDGCSQRDVETLAI